MLCWDKCDGVYLHEGGMLSNEGSLEHTGDSIELTYTAASSTEVSKTAATGAVNCGLSSYVTRPDMRLQHCNALQEHRESTHWHAYRQLWLGLPRQTLVNIVFYKSVCCWQLPPSGQCCHWHGSNPCKQDTRACLGRWHCVGVSTCRLAHAEGWICKDHLLQLLLQRLTLRCFDCVWQCGLLDWRWRCSGQPYRFWTTSYDSTLCCI